MSHHNCLQNAFYQSGLITATWAMLSVGMFGGSHHNIVGPTGQTWQGFGLSIVFHILSFNRSFNWNPVTKFYSIWCGSTSAACNHLRPHLLGSFHYATGSVYSICPAERCARIFCWSRFFHRRKSNWLCSRSSKVYPTHPGLLILYRSFAVCFHMSRARITKSSVNLFVTDRHGTSVWSTTLPSKWKI